MTNLTLINSGQGSQFRNDCGGFITTIKQPSPGFLVMEQWRDIEGYEGLYQVSNYGRIKSLPKHKHKYQSKILKPQLFIKTGYSMVSLYVNGHRKNCSIHRLVATAFIPNPDNKPEVNHKNSIRTDNTLKNLEWMTVIENSHHGFRNNDKISGEKHHWAKLNNFQVRVIRKCDDLLMREISDIFNVSTSHICQIRKKRCWKYINNLN